MERDKFIEAFAVAPGKLSEERTDKIIEACIKRLNVLYPDFPEGHFNCTSAMEEMSELTVAISQRMRGRTDNYGVLEEIGDVLLSILCIAKIFGITKEEICKAFNAKLEREYGKQVQGEDCSYMGEG